MKTISISDAKDDDGKVRVINQTETVKVLEKQERMIEEFKTWVWKNSARKQRLQAAYCRKYGNIKKRVFDGSFLEFPNMNPEIKLKKLGIGHIVYDTRTV